ncbi:transglutaminase-like domain-containing protein [Persicobacter psychrovividus]|uniref:DUF3857 domain-containing protein n=1 Tax=Persicobacter psychrovividus TaxID=387638 RepID=A0ABN6LAQ7_9BACT|nr:hypothetical protein PEPS_25500 [Persicobacter psychrovividus]
MSVLLYLFWLILPQSSTADAMILQEKLGVKVESPMSYTVTRERDVMIFNAEGAHLAEDYLFYDDGGSIVSFKGAVYNLNSDTPVRKSKQKDFIDRSIYNGGVSDYRVRRLDMTSGNYPYRVKIVSKIRVKKGFLSLPSWNPDRYLRTPVKSSIFEVQLPADYPVTVAEQNYPTAVEETALEKGGRLLKWAVNDLEARDQWEDYYPKNKQSITVSVVPQHFSYGNTVGNNASWQTFGQWYFELNKDKYSLPVALQEKTAELVKDKDRASAIQAIYQWVQKNNRYVSIQIGIGGFESAPSALTFSRGYGDCKALTTLTKGMLNYAGIAADPVLVYGGQAKREVDAGMVNNQFNHVILALPNAQDTTWLECTSDTSPVGYLGAFTGDRYGLYIKDQGSGLVKTKQYTLSDNILMNRAEMQLQANGTAIGEIEKTYQGVYFGEFLNWNQRTQKEQKAYYYSSLRMKSFTLQAHEESDEMAQFIHRKKINIEASNTVKKAGAKLFLTPNIFQNMGEQIKGDSRHFPIQQSQSFDQHNVVRWHLPAGYHPHKLPEPVELKSPFGTYHGRYEMQGNVLVWTRNYQYTAGKFPADDFEAFKAFEKAIYRAEKTRLMLVPTT